MTPRTRFLDTVLLARAEEQAHRAKHDRNPDPAYHAREAAKVASPHRQALEAKRVAVNRLLEEGQTVGQIAEALGMPVRTVEDYQRRRRERQRQRDASPKLRAYLDRKGARDAEIRDMAMRGMSNAAISSALGMTAKGVRLARRRLGLPPSDAPAGWRKGRPRKPEAA